MALWAQSGAWLGHGPETNLVTLLVHTSRSGDNGLRAFLSVGFEVLMTSSGTHSQLGPRRSHQWGLSKLPPGGGGALLLCLMAMAKGFIGFIISLMLFNIPTVLP